MGLKGLAEIYTMHSFAQLCTLNFFCKFVAKSFAKFKSLQKNKYKKNEIPKLCEGVHCVDLGETFQTHIFLQNVVPIQPRTSPVKFEWFGPSPIEPFN